MGRSLAAKEKGESFDSPFFLYIVCFAHLLIAYEGFSALGSLEVEVANLVPSIFTHELPLQMISLFKVVSL